MTKNEPKEKRINQIIDTAVQEFIEKGYEGASMQSIADRAGLTKGGIYYHFPSKDEIMLAANDRYFEPVVLLMQKAQGNQSPSKGLEEFIQAYLSHWAKHPRELVFTFLSLAKVLKVKEMWPSMETYREMMVSFYRDLLKAGVEAEELKEHDSGSRALAIFAALDGVTGYLVVCDSLKVEATAWAFIKTFIEDLKISAE
jgi:AcrR family transcriptional regulator